MGGKRDDEELLCRCEEVTRAEIDEAIAAGALTLDEIKRFTRAGMGLCQGKICSRVIAGYLAQKTGQSIQEMAPCTSRSPVRPLSLEAIATEAGDRHD